MAGWIVKLDDFISLSGREILNHAGRISHEMAKLKAESEYERFRATLPQPVDRHFAETIENLKKIENQAKKEKPRRKKKGDKQ